jgi:hypothetical protein
LDGVRLSDFSAGPAMITSQGFFSSEFIECHVVTTFVRGSTAMNSSRLSGRGSLLGELSNRDIHAERFTHQFRARSVLGLHGSFDLFRHLKRE